MSRAKDPPHHGAHSCLRLRLRHAARHRRAQGRRVRVPRFARLTSASIQPPPTDSDLPDIPADPREPILASAATVLLTKEHVLAKPIDDAVSKEAFAKYVEELDGGKVFFLAGHVQKLAKYETQMDDELRTGDLTLARKGTALLGARRKVIAGMVAELLSKPMDFTTQESIETDPKKRVFCKTEDELAAR